MRPNWTRNGRRRVLLAAILMCLAGVPASAQGPDENPPNSAGSTLPERPACFRQRRSGPAQGPCLESLPPCPSPQSPSPTQPNPMIPSPEMGSPSEAPSFGGLTRGADIGSNVALAPGGYIDPAMPKNMFRMRYDQGFNMNRPDRAEYFYAAWREISFHQHGILGQPGTVQNVEGRGLDPLPISMNYQEVSAYLELAGNRRMSAFVEIPFRMLHLTNLFIDPDGGDAGIPPNDPPGLHEALEQHGTSFGGLSDIVLGGKAAILADPDRFLTLQMRAFFPSGESRNGMGTGHYSVEPGLLYYRRLSDAVTLQGQFKAWIPIGGTTSVITDANGVTSTSFAGNILIYGLGMSYDLIQRPRLRVAPVAEFVGWTVLNGFQTVGGTGLFPFGGVPDDHGIAEAAGDTIVNGKLGIRAYFGAEQKDDFYIGVGQALTTARWYNEILRIEYRRSW